MRNSIGSALPGAALAVACALFAPASAQTVEEVYDPEQVRRVALSFPETGIARVENVRTDGAQPLLRLVAANGLEVYARGGNCEAGGCKVGRFVAVIKPPAGTDRQQLVDRYNDNPRWASAIVSDDTVGLRGELLFTGGVTDANLAQYLRSIMHHAARLTAGQP